MYISSPEKPVLLILFSFPCNSVQEYSCSHVEHEPQLTVPAGLRIPCTNPNLLR
jgi:hypothetical protein